MAGFALHGLHMVVNSSSRDKCIFIICISYLPTKANSSAGPTEKQPLPITDGQRWIMQFYFDIVVLSSIIISESLSLILFIALYNTTQCNK